MKMISSPPPDAEAAWRSALRNAAAYIEMNGWAPHASADAHKAGPADALSALAIVCVYAKPYTRALREFRAHLGADIRKWERAGRTKDDVIGALRAAASRPEGRRC